MRCPCGETRDDRFYPSTLKSSKGGWCKECHRAYYRRRVAEDREYFLKYARRRLRTTKDHLREEKARRGCAHCGENHPACLDFHHTDEAAKEFNISFAVSRGKKDFAALRAEIDKCIVLCSNCHRKVHYEKQLGVRSADIHQQRGPMRYGN